MKAELETSEQELAQHLKDQAIAEEEGWISQKVQFSEIATQTKDETEKKRWAAEFSRELSETRTQLRTVEKEKTETEDRLNLALVSWNPTISKEKAKLRAEIQDLKEATARPTDPEDDNPVDITVYQSTKRGQ